MAIYGLPDFQPWQASSKEIVLHWLKRKVPRSIPEAITVSHNPEAVSRWTS
jgi:hypothetical protein